MSFPALVKDVRSKTLASGLKEVYLILSITGPENIAKVVPFGVSEVLNVLVDITPTASQVRPAAQDDGTGN